MAATEVLNLHLGDKASNQATLLACAISSYLMAFRPDELADSHTGRSTNSPQPIIFFVMVTMRLRERLFEFNQGKVANEFIKILEDKLVKHAKPGHSRFLEFQSLLHSQLNPGEVKAENQAVLSGPFMQKIKTAHGDAANRLLNEYVAFACVLGYHKNIQDDIPEAFASFMPDR